MPLACDESLSPLKGGEFVASAFRLLTLLVNAIHDAESPRVFGGHEVIAVQRFLDPLVYLAGVFDVNLVQTALGIEDVLGMALDI
jgi:hypothetical protein